MLRSNQLSYITEGEDYSHKSLRRHAHRCGALTTEAKARQALLDLGARLGKPTHHRERPLIGRNGNCDAIAPRRKVLNFF